jgi:N-acetylneuraminic acid mutarotase
MPTARAALAAVTGLDGRIYAIGGFSATRGFVNTVEVYTTSTNTWSSVAPMPTPRALLAAATGSDGRIYAMGGVNFSNSLLNTVEAYNPSTNSWTTVANMPTGRQALAAATGSDGRIYAIGGTGGTNRVEAYSPSTNTWSTVASLSTARFDVAATTGADGQVYAFGGEVTVTVPINTTETYSSGRNNWSTVASMPTARSSIGAATGTDGRIYTMGGLGPNGLTATVESYSPSTNSWATEPSMPTIRDELAAATGPDGRIYAIGGGSVASPLSTVEALTYGNSAPRASNTVIISSADPSTHGQQVTFTATVTPSQGSGTPKGTVIFTDGSTTLGTVQVDGNGQARLSTSVLDLGDHAIVAAYGGDSVFSSSNSPVLTQTVNGALQFWQGGAPGSPTNWSNPANWVAGVVPGARDSVLLTGGTATNSVVDPSFGGTVAVLTIDASWNGTLTVNRSLSISGGLNLASGTWVGAGAVTLGGFSQWTGGTITLGAGGWTNNGILTLASASTLSFAGRGTLLNLGTINQTASLLSLLGDSSGATTIDNQGTFNFVGDANIDGSNGGGGVFVNESGFAKTSGTGVSTVNAFFDNRLVVRVRSGTLSLLSAGQVAGSTLTGGTWSVFDPASLILNSGVPLTTNNGNVVLDGPNAGFVNFNNLAANFGTFGILDGRAFSTVADFSNTGTLTIGASSVFTVNGNYTQDPKATLEIQLAGPSSSGQFGQLVVTGTATLGGTLTITLLNSYVPQSGDSYTILTFASRGTPPTSFATTPSAFGLTYDDGAGTLTLSVP